MKEDFRVQLYKKYVSTFKDVISPEDETIRKKDYESFHKLFLPLLKELPKDAEIIDLGCGSGYMLNFLKEQGYTNLYGIDISEEQIERLRRRGLDGDAGNIFEFMKNSPRQYDAIFALDFIEHFHREELLPLFNGIYNMLTNNGLLIIHTPNGQGLFPHKHIYGDLTHLTIFNPASLTQILKLTGFIDLNFYEKGPVMKNMKGVIRVILWKIVKLIVKSVRLIETGGKEDILTQDFITTARKKDQGVNN